MKSIVSWIWIDEYVILLCRTAIYLLEDLPILRFFFSLLSTFHFRSVLNVFRICKFQWSFWWHVQRTHTCIYHVPSFSNQPHTSNYCAKNTNSILLITFPSEICAVRLNKITNAICYIQPLQAQINSLCVFFCTLHSNRAFMSQRLWHLMKNGWGL